MKSRRWLLTGGCATAVSAVVLVTAAGAATPHFAISAALALHRQGSHVISLYPGPSKRPAPTPTVPTSASPSTVVIAPSTSATAPATAVPTASASDAPTPTAAPTETASGVPTDSPTDTAGATPSASQDPVGGFTLHRTYTFTGSSLDPDWAVYDTSYSSDPDARVPGLVTVSGGELHVATSGPQGSGLCLCRGDGKPSSPYGRWDIRARAGVNADHGFAILLWPNAEDWPTGGEIDIAEFPGADRTKLQTTVHYGSTNRQITGFVNGSFDDWHTYSVVWTPTELVYLVDDQPVMTVTDPAAIPTGAMHLALQAGLDNGVTSPSNTATSLDVAWVKVWR